MTVQRQNGYSGFQPSLRKPSMKKERSKIMERSRKELKRTRDYYRLPTPNEYSYVNKQQDKVAPHEIEQIPLEDLSNARLSLSRSIDGLASSTRNMENVMPSSSRSNIGVMSSAKNIEKSMPFSSRKNNGTMPLEKNIKNSRPSFSRLKNAEKSRPSCLQPKNVVNNAKKSDPSWSTDELSVGKLDKTTLVGSKDDSNFTMRVLKKSLPSPVVLSVHMTKNVVAMDQSNNSLDSMSKGLWNHNSNQLNGIALRNDSFQVSKCLKNKVVSILKDETVINKGKDNQISLRPIKRAMSGEFHQEDLCKSMEAPHSSSTLKGNKVMQDLQHISRISSYTIFGKSLSSHQPTEKPNDETLPRVETHIDDDSEEVEYCRMVKKRKRNMEIEDENDDCDQTLGAIEGVTDGLTSQTAIAKNYRTVVSKPFVLESFKQKHYNSLPNDETKPVQNVETYEDEDYEEAMYCRVTKKGRRLIETEYEKDDGDAQNLVGVEDITARLKTQAAIAKDWCTDVSMPFVSKSAELQHYSLLPIDEPIWSGIIKIGSKVYGPMAAHLSPKSCEKVWESSKLLLRVVEVTKLPRLMVWPKSFKASRPTVDNIALYFLPYKMTPDKVMDQLVKEVMDSDMILRAVVGEAEILIFPSILLPEQHKTFKGKPYLWGMFRPRKNKDAVVEEHHGAGCCAHEEMGKQNMLHPHEDHGVAGLDTDSELPAPEEAAQHAEGPGQPASTPAAAMPASHGQIPSSLGVPTGAPEEAAQHAEGPGQPASTPAAAMPASHGQIPSSLGVPTGAMFGFVVRQTPRLDKLIQEMEQEGALVVVMRGNMIG